MRTNPWRSVLFQRYPKRTPSSPWCSSKATESPTTDLASVRRTPGSGASAKGRHTTAGPAAAVRILVTGPIPPAEAWRRSSVSYGKSAPLASTRPAVSAPVLETNIQRSPSLTMLSRNGGIRSTSGIA